MPKEIVLGDTRFSPSDDEEEVEALVQVRWDPYPVGTVQIATFSRAKVTHDMIWDGYHTDLDREGINRLIKNLRRARDQAFGRDE